MFMNLQVRNELWIGGIIDMKNNLGKQQKQNSFFFVKKNTKSEMRMKNRQISIFQFSFVLTRTARARARIPSKDSRSQSARRLPDAPCRYIRRIDSSSNRAASRRSPPRACQTIIFEKKNIIYWSIDSEFVFFFSNQMLGVVAEFELIRRLRHRHRSTAFFLRLLHFSIVFQELSKVSVLFSYVKRFDTLVFRIDCQHVKHLHQSIFIQFVR